MFVDKTPVPICVDGDDIPEEARNVIYIRPKMSVGIRNRVIGAGTKIGKGRDSDVTLDVAAYSDALLRENITDWRGRDFDHVKLTPDAVANLDGDDPLVKRVLDEIAARNNAPADDDPNAAAPPAINGGGGASPVLDLIAVPGTNTFSAPNTTTGRRKP